MQDSAIYQRTESGRNEIRNKLHGLTQSERLVLIVVDGVTPYGAMRLKLKGLVQERFDRALSKLLQKRMIIEVLLPTDDDVADNYDSATVDRFLQQDPLDPVTIISFDPEDEFGLDDAPSPVADATQALGSVLVQSQYASVDSNQLASEHSSQRPPQARLVQVDFYIPLTPITNGQKAGAIGARGHAASAQHHHWEPLHVDFATAPSKTSWAQILMVVGMMVIVAWIILRFMHGA